MDLIALARVFLVAGIDPQIKDRSPSLVVEQLLAAAKRQARKLETAFETPHRRTLEALAKACGFGDWHAFETTFSCVGTKPSWEAASLSAEQFKMALPLLIRIGHLAAPTPRQMEVLTEFGAELARTMDRPVNKISQVLAQHQGFDAWEDLQFWSVVEAVRLASTDVQARPAALESQLRKLNEEDLRSFARTFWKTQARLCSFPILQAMDLITPLQVGEDFLSWDGFRDSLSWLISEGRQRCEQAARNPDAMADWDIPDDISLDEYGFAIHVVAEERGIGSTIGHEHPQGYMNYLHGEELSPMEVSSQFPKLNQRSFSRRKPRHF